MKIGVLPVSFFHDLKTGKMTIEECAELVVSSGASGIDLSPRILGDINSNTVRHIRKAVESTGLEIGMMVGYTDFTHPVPAVRKLESERINELICIASEIGAEFVRLTAGQAYPETGRDEGIRYATEGLLATLQAGKRYGVHLVYENHSKPSNWSYPDFSWPSDIFLEIAEKIIDTDIDILFDTANPVARGEDPLKILLAVIERVRYVHASDSRANGVFSPVLLGTGAVPFDSIFTILKQSGYNGWISVEEASQTGHGAVKKAVEFVKNRWENV